MSKRIGLAALALGVLVSATALAESEVPRSGYSYVREVAGEVAVDSRLNGRVEARRNMPISAGDEITVSDSGRVEVGLADGNLLHIDGRTRARFESLYAQQGENDDFSSIKLREGSLILSAIGANERQIPRIDTEEATVYLSAGARVRVNADSRRGTTVVARAGTVEVRTPQGTSTLRAGQYLMVRDGEDAEIERGSFSRDRFDLWAADRLETLSETRSSSARYVDPEYQSDVVALDGYGDWNYNDSYSTNVWSPRVGADWSPYSQGSWYYTPAGLTWWSNDPWGWYPFHYGNWFFDASWRRWCWAPAHVYSPAWVYWAYTPSYVGWCPTGYYSFYSPWYDTYYRRWGWTRPGVYISIRGTFDTRRVDFRGWNFVGSGGFATARRMEVIPGSRIGDRLGPQVAISSRPIVVNARPGGVGDSIREFVREAPRVIERTASGDSGRLAPILARDRTLPPASVEALRERGVIAERGRLAGASAADIAPRGALVDRSRGAGEIGRREPMAVDRGRAVAAPGRAPEVARPDSSGRSRNVESFSPRAVERPDARVLAPPEQREDWRTRGRTMESRPVAPESRSVAPREGLRSDRIEAAPPAERRIERAPSADWRARGRALEGSPAPAPRAPERPSQDEWRSRSEVPPARRVIDGAVPGRRPEVRSQPAAPETEWRTGRVEPPRQQFEARPEVAPRGRDFSAPRSAPPPRVERAPAYAPPPRAERPPAYAPPPSAPRGEAHRAAPPPPHADRSRKQ